MRSTLALAIATLLAAGAAGAVGACAASRAAGSGRVQVVASFSPIAWVAEEVAGADAEVTSLTKAGTEPHDLELTPRQVGRVIDADLVLYVDGFQPSVDHAVGEAHRSRVLELSEAADLDLRLGSRVDPHFWLDPLRLASVARATGDRLAAADPDHAGGYRDRTQRLSTRLAQLDTELREGLSDCERRTIVTSHGAFGYLARRYDLRQVSIAGLSPDAEPSPSDLASVTADVRRHHVTTIFFEALVSPAVAKAVAEETGARTDVLDPLESITDDSQGDGYVQVMQSNLANLRRALGCR
jgi:zinc transport system substrate-binding protein